MASIKMVNHHNYTIALAMEPEGFSVDIEPGEGFEVTFSDKEHAIEIHFYTDKDTGLSGVSIWSNKSDYSIMHKGGQIY